MLKVASIFLVHKVLSGIADSFVSEAMCIVQVVTISHSEHSSVLSHCTGGAEGH